MLVFAPCRGVALLLVVGCWLLVVRRRCACCALCLLWVVHGLLFGV